MSPLFSHGFGAQVLLSWTFGVVIITAATLVNATERQQLQGKPTSQMEGCVGMMQSWFCWVWGTWVSWGSNIENMTQAVEEETVQNLGCATVRCYTLQAVDLMFDGLGLLISNPLSLWSTWIDIASYIFTTKMTFIMRFMGALISFALLNVAAFAYMRLADLLSHISKAVVLFFHLPIMALMFRFISSVWSFVVNAAKKDKEKKDSAKKEERSVAVVKAEVAKDVEKLRKLLEDLKTRSEIDDVRAMFSDLKKALIDVMEKREGDRSDVVRKTKKPRCPFCGKPNHTEVQCWKKMAAEGNPPPHWKGQDVKRPPMDNEKKDIAGPSTPPVVQETARDEAGLKTLLYTPAVINDVRFSRCLVDTGSEVNLISIRDAIKHGFAFSPGGVQRIRGFNGSESAVNGMMKCCLQVGTSMSCHDAEFLVTADVTVPVIGLPALSALGISVDCKSHELTDLKTGDVVRCSAATCPKNC